jgi:hypothetical protein
MVLGFFAIDEDEPSTEEDRRVDWIGATLITCGLILIAFVLSDTPTAQEGWRNPRESSVFLCWHVPQMFVIRRYHWPLPHRRPPRLTVCSVAILLGAKT